MIYDIVEEVHGFLVKDVAVDKNAIVDHSILKRGRHGGSHSWQCNQLTNQ
jgi:hypothetical protein